jgi:hypothetical protein
MSRNKCFLQVRISHVLRFISICDLFTDSPSYFAVILRSALIVKIFLAKDGIVEISHPPYSPDLSPANFVFSFLR